MANESYPIKNLRENLEKIGAMKRSLSSDRSQDRDTVSLLDAHISSFRQNSEQDFRTSNGIGLRKSSSYSCIFDESQKSNHNRDTEQKRRSEGIEECLNELDKYSLKKSLEKRQFLPINLDALCDQFKLNNTLDENADEVEAKKNSLRNESDDESSDSDTLSDCFRIDSGSRRSDFLSSQETIANYLINRDNSTQPKITSRKKIVPTHKRVITKQMKNTSTGVSTSKNNTKSFKNTIKTNSTHNEPSSTVKTSSTLARKTKNSSVKPKRNISKERPDQSNSKNRTNNKGNNQATQSKNEKNQSTKPDNSAKDHDANNAPSTSRNQTTENESNQQSATANVKQPTQAANNNEESSTRSNQIPNPDDSQNTPEEDFTSPSNRHFNPNADNVQSNKATRTQPIPKDPNSAKAAKQDLETWLQHTAQSGTTCQPQKRNFPGMEFPIIRPCDKDITIDPEDCKRKLEQKLDRMYNLKKEYYSNNQDDIPFINLEYTKEGVFVDEPLERALVYDESFLKNENSSSSTVASLESRYQSKSLFFSPLRLNSRTDKNLSSFPYYKFNSEQSSASKWVDKILEETETNIIGDVLQEFEQKFNKLAANLRTRSSSETSSARSEPINRIRNRMIIPKRPSRRTN